MNVPNRLLVRAISGYRSDDGNTEKNISTERVRAEHLERHHSPDTIVFEDGTIGQFPDMEGTIACFRTPRDDGFVQGFRDDISNLDPDAYEAFNCRQTVKMENVGRIEPTTIADLEYAGELVITGLGYGANSAEAFDIAEFEDVHPSPSEFRIREYALEEVEDEKLPDYEYVVIVVPPEQSPAEMAANAAVSERKSGAALNPDQEESSAVTLVAVGAVLGAAAVYGSGRVGVDVPDRDEIAVDPRASVDELVTVREEFVA